MHRKLDGILNNISSATDTNNGSGMASAGGAAAAAPEGGAFAGPSAPPHLPVVGDGNPVAVPGLAR
jgi:hypothetical protein